MRATANAVTLIAFQARVHFADGVLEEALRSELEACRARRPLIVSDGFGFPDGALARVLAATPARRTPVLFEVSPGAPDRATVEAATRAFQAGGCDHLIAFGGVGAVDLAKIVREAGAPRSGLRAVGARPSDAARGPIALIAIPCHAGLASALNPGAAFYRARRERIALEAGHGPASVTICDPALTHDAEPAVWARAGALAIARCVEAYLSRAYNPPAEGVALDGLMRALRALGPRSRLDGASRARELMAASLDAALAQQKGLGAVHAIASAFEDVAGPAADAGALSGVVLPGVLRFHAAAACDTSLRLARLSGVGSDTGLAEGVEALLAGLPLPRRLADLGFGPQQIEAAAAIAADSHALRNGPRIARARDLFEIMMETG